MQKFWYNFSSSWWIFSHNIFLRNFCCPSSPFNFFFFLRRRRGPARKCKSPSLGSWGSNHPRWGTFSWTRGGDRWTNGRTTTRSRPPLRSWPWGGMGGEGGPPRGSPGAGRAAGRGRRWWRPYSRARRPPRWSTCHRWPRWARASKWPPTIWATVWTTRTCDSRPRKLFTWLLNRKKRDFPLIAKTIPYLYIFQKKKAYFFVIQKQCPSCYPSPTTSLCQKLPSIIILSFSSHNRYFIIHLLIHHSFNTQMSYAMEHNHHHYHHNHHLFTWDFFSSSECLSPPVV